MSLRQRLRLDRRRFWEYYRDTLVVALLGIVAVFHEWQTSAAAVAAGSLLVGGAWIGLHDPLRKPWPFVPRGRPGPLPPAWRRYLHDATIVLGFAGAFAAGLAVLAVLRGYALDVTARQVGVWALEATGVAWLAFVAVPGLIAGIADRMSGAPKRRVPVAKAAASAKSDGTSSSSAGSGGDALPGWVTFSATPSYDSVLERVLEARVIVTARPAGKALSDVGCARCGANLDDTVALREHLANHK